MGIDKQGLCPYLRACCLNHCKEDRKIRNYCGMENINKCLEIMQTPSWGSVRGMQEVHEGLTTCYKYMQELPNAGFLNKPEK